MKKLNKTEKDSVEYEVFRSSAIKEFEIILEQVGKLLKKLLKFYFHSSKVVDKLYFKEIFRNAVKFDILNIDEVTPWLEYRDNRNSTAHYYGVGFAKDTLILLPQFIIDSRNVVNSINSRCNASS